MTNKTRGVLWIVGPMIFIFVWFVIFGIVTVIAESIGGNSVIMHAIFPLITGFAILMIPVGLGIGISNLNKDKKVQKIDPIVRNEPNSGELKFCGECGNKIKLDSKYCSKCGKTQAQK